MSGAIKRPKAVKALCVVLITCHFCWQSHACGENGEHKIISIFISCQSYGNIESSCLSSLHIL